ncbi:PhzA/PhzB family protein [Microbacterium sp.]|uniref:PhzA/PhzB family protein n=1 Tax=Microbacterium sp. TaxID=51671 RepID=UPI0039E31979
MNDAPDGHDERERNRQTVARFFELGITDERRALYADDGVKELVNFGLRWSSPEALRAGDERNAALCPDWHHKDARVWPTDDPRVFWVEASGEGHRSFGGADPQLTHSDYVFRIELDGGKIVRLREWKTIYQTPQ